jgi:hypothetical protein
MLPPAAIEAACTGDEWHFNSSTYWPKAISPGSFHLHLTLLHLLMLLPAPMRQFLLARFLVRLNFQCRACITSLEQADFDATLESPTQSISIA